MNAVGFAISIATQTFKKHLVPKATIRLRNTGNNMERKREETALAKSILNATGNATLTAILISKRHLAQKMLRRLKDTLVNMVLRRGEIVLALNSRPR